MTGDMRWRPALLPSCQMGGPHTSLPSACLLVRPSLPAAVSEQAATRRYASKNPGAEGSPEADAEASKDGEFGFVTLDRTHTLKSFNAYADWVKRTHFGAAHGTVCLFRSLHSSI